MEIFGKHIFGSCAEAWLKLCKEQKRDWILKRTNQKDETLITEFINNPQISKECKCLDCGKNKVNEPNGISKEVATTTESIETGADSVGDSVKRQPKSKRRKG
jgi:hypothetical protein